MYRHADSLSALNVALNLMIDAGDTLLVAAIAYPMQLVEAQIMQRRGDILTAQSAAAAGRQASYSD